MCRKMIEDPLLPKKHPGFLNWLADLLNDLAWFGKDMPILRYLPKEVWPWCLDRSWDLYEITGRAGTSSPEANDGNEA